MSTSTTRFSSRMRGSHSDPGFLTGAGRGGAGAAVATPRGYGSGLSPRRLGVRWGIHLMVRAAGGWLTGRMLRNAWRGSAGWMLLFAGVHVYWGFGGTALLPAGVSVLDSTALFVIDLLAVPLCLAGAAVSWLLRPDQRPGKLASRSWLLWPATLASLVMLGHV